MKEEKVKKLENENMNFDFPFFVLLFLYYTKKHFRPNV
jgi:hypothetical protein